MELSPILRKAGLNGQPLGYLEVSYKGVFLGLGAQLTLYPGGGLTGIDSARTVSGDYKTGNRSASFWLPEWGKAKIALSNVSSTALGIHVRCGDTDEQITLIPNSTALRDIGSAASANNGPGTSIGCDLTSSGPSDSLRADGLITGPNGYGAPIRFYDLTTSTSQALTSVGLDPSAKTYVTVHNVLNHAVTVNPILREASLSAGQEQKLAPVSLDAYSTTSIPIDSKLKLFDVARTSRVSLTLDTSAPTGALVGSVTQIGAEDGIVEDVRDDLRLNVAERLDDSGDEGCLSAVVDILASTDYLSTRSGALDYLKRNQKIPSDLTQTLQVGLERALRDQIPTSRQSASDAIAMFAPPSGWTLLIKAIAVEKDDATRLKMQQDLAQLKARNSNTPRNP